MLQPFRHKRAHLAVVVDGYGSVEGILTLEDIAEESEMVLAAMSE